jgi:hypothetical protein
MAESQLDVQGYETVKIGSHTHLEEMDALRGYFTDDQ